MGLQDDGAEVTKAEKRGGPLYSPSSFVPLLRFHNLICKMVEPHTDFKGAVFNEARDPAPAVSAPGISSDSEMGFMLESACYYGTRTDRMETGHAARGRDRVFNPLQIGEFLQRLRLAQSASVEEVFSIPFKSGSSFRPRQPTPRTSPRGCGFNPLQIGEFLLSQKLNFEAEPVAVYFLRTPQNNPFSFA